MCCSWKEEIWIPPSGGATKVECALAHVGFGRAAAGQEIKKLSFDRISRRVTGDQTIAVVAWHGPQQPLWPNSRRPRCRGERLLWQHSAENRGLGEAMIGAFHRRPYFART